MESVRLCVFALYALYMVLTKYRSVSIKVGSPPQWIDVFVSTQSRETWVVGLGGCDGSMCFLIFELTRTINTQQQALNITLQTTKNDQKSTCSRGLASIEQ